MEVKQKPEMRKKQKKKRKKKPKRGSIDRPEDLNDDNNNV